MTSPECLLIRKIPRLPIAVCFPRNLHWNWDDPLKLFQVTIRDTRHTPMHWHNHSAFPITTVDFGLFRCPILGKLAPGALRTVG